MAYPNISMRQMVLLTLVLSLGGVACRPEREVRAYKIPKETHRAPVLAAGHSTNDGLDHGAETGAESSAEVGWTKPESWIEVPKGQFRVASFKIEEDQKTADVSVVPLPGGAGSDLDNVNRWREEIGLEGVQENQLTSEEVNIGDHTGRLFRIPGASEASTPVQTLAAIFHEGEKVWFFKLKGDGTLVEKSKADFIQFLASFKFGYSHESTPKGRGKAGKGEESLPWNVPSTWQQIPKTEFLMAKYLVPGTDGKRAEMTVSSLPGDVGGGLMNLNRWRGQLGLAPVEEDQMGKLTSVIDVQDGRGMLVDMVGNDVKAGTKARMMVVMVPREGSTWFFKFMGAETVIENERAAFLRVVQNADLPQ